MAISRKLAAALSAAAALSFCPSASAVGEPENRSAPQVTRSGLTLTTTDGTWVGQTEPYTYEWLRCADTTIESCRALSGETRRTYELNRADIGSRMRSRVTAYNPAGVANKVSAPTGVVEERLFDSPPPAPTPRPRPRYLSPRPVVTIAGLRRGRFTFVNELSVRGPRFAVVRLTCRGRGCPVRRLGTRIGPSRRVRLRRAEGTYRAGTVLEIRVVDDARERIGKFTRVRFRGNGREPVRTDSCLQPGAKRPSPCP